MGQFIKVPAAGFAFIGLRQFEKLSLDIMLKKYHYPIQKIVLLKIHKNLDLIQNFNSFTNLYYGFKST